MKKNQSTGATGLLLPRTAVRVLKDRGIFAHSPVSLEHQHLANRYVIRGVESGGAVGDVGRYITFAAENGQALEYLHPVEAIGVNGVHAVVIAPTLVRIDILRKACTYELLITQHGPGQPVNGQRPQLESKILFRGVHGRLELDLAGKDKAQAGSVMPTFYSLAGEEIAVPKRLRQAVRAATKAVNCIGCAHCHYVRAPRKRNASIATATGESASAIAPRAIDVKQTVPSPELPVSADNNRSSAVADAAA